MFMIETTSLKHHCQTIEPEAGAFMHMEVTKDKDRWTKQVVGDFYRKNSVMEVDRKH